jgi:hypothetical protein
MRCVGQLPSRTVGKQNGFIVWQGGAFSFTELVFIHFLKAVCFGTDIIDAHTRVDIPAVRIDHPPVLAKKHPRGHGSSGGRLFGSKNSIAGRGDTDTGGCLIAQPTFGSHRKRMVIVEIQIGGCRPPEVRFTLPGKIAVSGLPRFDLPGYILSICLKRKLADEVGQIGKHILAAELIEQIPGTAACCSRPGRQPTRQSRIPGLIMLVTLQLFLIVVVPHRPRSAKLASLNWLLAIGPGCGIILGFTQRSVQLQIPVVLGHTYRALPCINELTV